MDNKDRLINEELMRRNEIPRPDFIWEKTSCTIDEIVRSHQLPRVIQYDVQVNPSSCENFDMSTPLLAYKHREIRQVSSSVLCYDESEDKIAPIGNPLIIPEDYPGWFGVLPKPGQNRTMVVPHFTTIEKLASSDTQSFLIGGNKKARAIVLEKHHMKYQSYLLPGETLTVGKVFSGQVKVKNKGILKTSKVQEEKFLSCRDIRGREVILPLREGGVFYPIQRKQLSYSNHVMALSEIVKTQKFPCVVKLVYGGMPNTPCAFTGVLQLNAVYLEESVISSTILNFTNILLEVPYDDILRYHVAREDKVLLANKGYQSALQLCESKANIYMKNMKVSHRYSDDPLYETFPKDAKDRELQNTIKEFNRSYKEYRADAMGSDSVLPQTILKTNGSSKKHSNSFRTDASTSNIYEQIPAISSENGAQSSTAGSWIGKGGYLTKPIYSNPAPSRPVSCDGYKPPVPPKPKQFSRLGSSSYIYDEITSRPSSIESNKLYCNVGELDLASESDEWDSDSNDGDDLVYENVENLRELLTTRSGDRTGHPCPALSTGQGIEGLPCPQGRTSASWNEQADGIYCNTEHLKKPSTSTKARDRNHSSSGPNSDNRIPGPKFKRNDKAISRDSGIGEDKIPITRLSTKGLASELRKLKINEKVVTDLASMNIDGSFLSTFDADLLKEASPSIKGIDLQRILMFINGWRPEFN